MAEQNTSRHPDGTDGGGGPVDGHADAEIAALLCTRLCHDLSGPIGAMAAGAELIADGDDGFLSETAALLTHSADGAVARLKVLRLALGIPGSDRVALQETVASYLNAVNGINIGLDWQIDRADLIEGGHAVRLLLNMILLAVDAVAGRGVITVKVSLDDLDQPQVLVEARGPRAGLSAAQAEALAGRRASVTARTVQGYWLACLAAPFGGVRISEAVECLGLSARLPRGGK